ncbi:hypothetical protein CMI47_21455 [Candidatus Pacearchaeota archaeon]|jgi:hypothetical protein|nr:hypothetical protein [Candidatus Pacearchaeota archaeon]|tara:strand:- start:2682 stop:3140 length:459 start_codon:yes stop_codon:yes gene_type:complete
MAIREGKYYTFPQETWDERKCAKLVKRVARDGMGTKYPFPGYIGSGASIPPTFGRIRYNGGCEHDGDWWEGEIRQFPQLADGYEIIHVATWGWRIVKTTMIEYHREPTAAEIKFGHGATHYKDFRSDKCRKPNGDFKRWLVCPDDGLRYYRN